MTVPTYTIKRGDTFAPQCAVLEGEAAVSIAGWAIASQVRTAEGYLVATLAVGSRNDAAGTYQLTTAAGTAKWPAGVLQWDVQYTDAGGVVISTETVSLVCEQDVTA